MSLFSIPPVHILASCRRPDLAPMTTLVFDSLRTGFPNAEVTVHLNGDVLKNCPNAAKAAEAVGCKVIEKAATIHHEYIEALVQKETEPFWVLDSDVIFFESVENWKFSTALAGWRIPEWQSESGGITRSRLHGSLLYIDPLKVKDAVEEFNEQHPLSDFMPPSNLFYPLVTPMNGRKYFYDTCSLLYHLIGGTSFTDRQKDSYFHFFFGSIPDLVLPQLGDTRGMESTRAKILSQPQMGKGAWREQQQWYEARPVRPLHTTELPAPDPQHAEEARKWNTVLCNGNQEAMGFNDLWYSYCHGIDDLIDTLEDGRPTLGKEAIIELFATAAVLYNHNFYKQHQQTLFPIVLNVTNSFADSVSWEKSPLFRRRVMADALRTCGNEMYHMIALICGGWKHVRAMSPLIRDRDWQGQHDKDNNSESISYGRS